MADESVVPVSAPSISKGLVYPAVNIGNDASNPSRTPGGGGGGGSENDGQGMPEGLLTGNEASCWAYISSIFYHTDSIDPDKRLLIRCVLCMYMYVYTCVYICLAARHASYKFTYVFMSCAFCVCSFS